MQFNKTVQLTQLISKPAGKQLDFIRCIVFIRCFRTNIRGESMSIRNGTNTFNSKKP